MFLGGFEADEPRTSGFFKLQKICTLENIYLSEFIVDLIPIPQVKVQKR